MTDEHLILNPRVWNIVQTPLNASASPAGALLSGSIFEIPQFQREYSWEQDEVADFWTDLRDSITGDSYFLGLIILTEGQTRKQVVDGQQRLLTLTLLATALYHEAGARGRRALAERIQADFLSSIDYDTDETHPRVTLSDHADNRTLQTILETGSTPNSSLIDPDSISRKLADAYTFLRDKLRKDLATDPFKRLGAWTDFITNRLYFAVFLHPDTASAYRVFEVINTRGKELTTADLLKNYVLSQTSDPQREELYSQWQWIARQFGVNGASSFVQFIRHIVTVQNGHILPKDLYDFLAQRRQHAERMPPTPNQLMSLMHRNLPLYMQMVDPSLAGPAEPEALRIFSALNSLSVIAVRPILLALSEVPNSIEGMRYILSLVVRRIVVGNLGTGNVERRFGETALHIRESGRWEVMVQELQDLNPTKQDFVEQLARRSFGKGVLTFIRSSIIENDICAADGGTLHFVMPKNANPWPPFSEEDAAYWGGTIGNTILCVVDRRPSNTDSWKGFIEHMIPAAVQGEWKRELEEIPEWNAETLGEMGKSLALAAGEIWYK